MPNLVFNKRLKIIRIFYQRCIRRILKIKLEDVRELMIKYVQGRLFSKKRLIYIVNIIRITCKYVATRLISAF